MFKFVSKSVIIIALLAIVLTACGPAATTASPGCPRNRGSGYQPVHRRLQLPQPLLKAALLLLEPSGAPAPKSSSSLVEQQVVALRP